jgi:hypothetical protein
MNLDRQRGFNANAKWQTGDCLKSGGKTECVTAESSRSRRLARSGVVGHGSRAQDNTQIGVSNTVQGNGWREEMICAMKAQALASANVASLNIAHRNTDAPASSRISAI